MVVLSSSWRRVVTGVLLRGLRMRSCRLDRSIGRLQGVPGRALGHLRRVDGSGRVGSRRR